MRERTAALRAAGPQLPGPGEVADQVVADTLPPVGALGEAVAAALTAGCTALLAGDLDTLAVTVDDEGPALYSPARDEHGALDGAQP